MRFQRSRTVLSIFFSLALVLASCLTACGGVSTYQEQDNGETLADRVNSGLSIKAERGSKTLDIQRTKPGGKKPSGIEKGTWTVFVYLCGSDLETKGGAATKDLSEMVAASGSDNVSFVVETGGAKQWRSNVKTNKLGRYLIQNGSIMEVGSANLADMGNPDTLSDFLTWGLKNYPAEHMGVILWDHGGGSISGSCFDERNNFNALLLRELDAAFAKVNSTLWKKFDFVGFDACLMSTLETANILASYADYMYASQETEPSGGWDYSSLIEYLAKNPNSNGAKLGKAICDSYLSSLDPSSLRLATLAVIDLSQIDTLMQDFYRFSQEMYSSGGDQGTLAAMTRGIKKAECYGGNNWLEGYTNMVDLGGIVNACSEVTPSAADVQQTLSKAVTYQVRGRHHANSSGLSAYYPLKINKANELATFETVAVNPSYLSYVDRVVHGGTYNGGTQYQQYSDSGWYEGNVWSWLTGSQATQQTGQGSQQGQGQQQVAEQWQYVEEHTDSSSVITFAEKPQVDDDGVYWFQLDQKGIDNAATVSALVYEHSGDDVLTLGETYEVYGDWESGTFEDGFDGKWLSLPDGQNLCTYVASSNEDEVVYTSPINLNGTDCYLRIRQDLKSGDVTVEGAWTGIGANGSVDRGTTKVKKGDKIIPLYSTESEGGATSDIKYDYEGDPFEVTTRLLKVEYKALPTGTYNYAFNITDTYGDTFVTDKIQLDIEKDGIYFTE